MTHRKQLRLEGHRVLDGAMATELERRGVATGGPLWSARALREAPEAVLDVHRAYLAAGADVLLTASYQVSTMGFAAAGAPDPARAAAEALRQSVASAMQARDEARTEIRDRQVLVAVSLGPYGAALANGAEFHGEYGFASRREEQRALVAFHRERIAVLAETGADLLAFETVPSQGEARAIAEALAEWPELAAWISWTCREGGLTAHGEAVRDCAGSVEGVPQIVAAGVNCTHPGPILGLLAELRAGTEKPLVVYPNSGEGWDKEQRCWTGNADVPAFGALALEWFRAGAQLVGGCCRTGPEHVKAVAQAARDLRVAG